MLLPHNYNCVFISVATACKLAPLRQRERLCAMSSPQQQLVFQDRLLGLSGRCIGDESQQVADWYPRLCSPGIQPQSFRGCQVMHSNATSTFFGERWHHSVFVTRVNRRVRPTLVQNVPIVSKCHQALGVLPVRVRDEHEFLTRF
jgi:hypothetical protein